MHAQEALQKLATLLSAVGGWALVRGYGTMLAVGEALGKSRHSLRENLVTMGIMPWGVLRNRNQYINLVCNPSYTVHFKLILPSLYFTV